MTKKGEDGSELYADRSEKILIVRHPGKDGTEYEFKYRDMTWSGRNKAISAATSIDNANKGHFDLDRYKRLCLTTMITQHPFKEDLEIALIKIDSGIGEQLETIIPKPTEIIGEEEEGFTEPQ